MPENARERAERESRQELHRRYIMEASEIREESTEGEAQAFVEIPHARVLIDQINRETTIIPTPITGETSDGYHTFNELYRYRMLYHAAFVNAWELIDGINDPYPFPADPSVSSVKSWKHSDGEPCFGGGWFIVVTTLPTGQISNHYEAQHWDLFNVPEVDLPPTYDGHTPAEAAARLGRFLVEYR